METTAKTSLFSELLKRRVFQIVGLYFGAIFAVMEFTDLMVEQYNLSDVTIDVVLAGMVSFLPAVIVLAWGFGAPGKDDWGKAEKITLPINIIVTISLVITLIYSQDVESVVDTVESSDDNGQTIVREVPKLKYISRIKFFFTDIDENLPEESHWLSYGIPIMLEAELGQNPFISASTLYNQSTNGLLWRVKRAGFEDGMNVPVGLAKSLSKGANLDYFVMADLSQMNEELQLNTRVYNAKTGKLIAENATNAANAFALVYNVASLLKEQIKVQSAGEQLTSYVSAEERLTSDLQSFQAFVRGLNHWSFNNDLTQAKQEIETALRIDPTFAIAHLHLLQLNSEQGQFAEALKNAQDALQYSYKLTESQLFQIRGIRYALSGDREEQRRVYEVWNKLHPTSVPAKNALANSYMWSGNEIDPAIKVLKESLELDPNQNWIYSRLGLLYESKEAYEQASSYHSQYAQRNPTSYLPHLALARIARKQGDLAAARENTLTAMYLRTDMVTPVVSMADLALREGKFDEALQRQQEAEIIAIAPNQKTNVLVHQIIRFTQQGKISQAFATLLSLQENMAEYANPVDTLVATKLSQMDLYTLAGKQDIAKAELDSLQNSIQAPFDKMISIGYLFHYLSINDAQNAQIHFDEVDALMRAQKMQHLFHVLFLGEGMLYYIKEDYPNAIAKFKEAQKSFNESVNQVNEDHVIDSVNLFLVRALKLSENYDEARRTALNVLKEWPYHSYINFELAQIERALGNNEEAKQALEKAMYFWEDADEDFAEKQQSMALAAEIELNK